MVSLILGRKGSGKTKHLIEQVDKAVEVSKGNVVCVEKASMLTYEVNYRARLIDTDRFGIEGYDAFYGLLCGVCAGDHDITDILADATLRIGCRDMDELAAFLKKVAALGELTDTKFTFTVSADKEDLPAVIFDYCEQI